MTTSTTTWPAGVKIGARVKFTNRDADVVIEGEVDDIDSDGEVYLEGGIDAGLYPRGWAAEVVTPAPAVLPTEPGLYVERGRTAANVGSLLYRLDGRGEWTATAVSLGSKWVRYYGGAPTGADLVALKVAE